MKRPVGAHQTPPSKLRRLWVTRAMQRRRPAGTRALPWDRFAADFAGLPGGCIYWHRGATAAPAAQTVGASCTHSHYRGHYQTTWRGFITMANASRKSAVARSGNDEAVR